MLVLLVKAHGLILRKALEVVPADPPVGGQGYRSVLAQERVVHAELDLRVPGRLLRLGLSRLERCDFVGEDEILLLEYHGPLLHVAAFLRLELCSPVPNHHQVLGVPLHLFDFIGSLRLPLRHLLLRPALHLFLLEALTAELAAVFPVKTLQRAQSAILRLDGVGHLGHLVLRRGQLLAPGLLERGRFLAPGLELLLLALLYHHVDELLALDLQLLVLLVVVVHRLLLGDLCVQACDVDADHAHPWVLVASRPFGHALADRRDARLLPLHRGHFESRHG
mmetsp:Transcript_89765/g.256556  ORF Transcript_89765/g.256556 Transcript_89765/m.256556 type:complete len:279 (-) Transcript_89765:69-905(-)